MFKQILKKMRDKIRSDDYVITRHAIEEMLNDNLRKYDIEYAILIGEIIECQKDKITNERKYIIEGNTKSNGTIKVVTKLGMTGKLYIITVYKI